MISPEVWLPPYTPFDHPLSPQNFFTPWPLILNHDLELCHTGSSIDRDKDKVPIFCLQCLGRDSGDTLPCV